MDNDGDGQTDAADHECQDADDGVEDGNPPQCSNGFDDDGDGQTDFPNDAGCDSAQDNTEEGGGGEEEGHRCAPPDGLDLGGGGTVTEQAYHGLLTNLEGTSGGDLVTEPMANGGISSEFYDQSQGTQFEPLGEESGCALSVAHQGEL